MWKLYIYTTGLEAVYYMYRRVEYTIMSARMSENCKNLLDDFNRIFNFILRHNIRSYNKYIVHCIFII
jgi:hypothetical protein